MNSSSKQMNSFNYGCLFTCPRPFAWAPAPGSGPNLYLPALTPNLYLPAMTPNLYLPVMTPN